MKKWMTGALLLVLAGCGSGNKGEQAKADYNRSLGDSIEKRVRRSTPATTG